MNMKRHRMRGHGGHGNGNGTGGNNRYGGGGQRFNQPRNNFGGNNLENDRRIRANAIKMIEKYQNMAKDAQMNGDIILAENYFQYADHYQRVSNAHAPRFLPGHILTGPVAVEGAEPGHVLQIDILDVTP
ncbi:MAG: DUF4167 domain-containing protein, partial [Alphaproteobacteria bacterium]|nr:DUF4167 domain-containing protein [Alphaproteobacteria bacterium]